MIGIEKCGKYRRCGCCFSNEDVKEIAFRADSHGVVVALCAKCRKELLRELEKERMTDNG